MTISFDEIPNNVRVPLFYAEFDNSRASTALSSGLEALLVGQKLAAGTISPLTPILVNSAEQAKEYFGRGSMLARMVEKYFLNNEGKNRLTCIAFDDPAGTKKIVEIAFTGPATAAGVVTLYAGGRRYQVAVADAATPVHVANILRNAVNADDDRVFEATTTTHTLTLTHVHNGVASNSAVVELNYYDNEVFPANISATVTDTDGTGSVDLSTIVPVLPERQFQLIGLPYADVPNLTALHTELASRFGPRQLDGFAIHAKQGTLSDLTTFGDALNSQFSSIVGYEGGLQDEAEWAAATLGTVISPAQIDPARPFQTLQIKGIVAPNSEDQFTVANRETLLAAGVATFFISSGGNVLVERLVTTFKTNAFGSPDNSYMDLNTLLTLSLLRNEVKAMTESKYPRHKLGNDGQIYGGGQAIITPNTYRAELIVLASSWVERALMEDLDGFKEGLIVQRNTADPNRLDVLLPPDLVNQLRIVGVKIQFLLQGA